LDVGGDDHVAPDDALLVINYLNSLPPRPAGEGEFDGAVPLETPRDPLVDQSSSLYAKALLQILNEDLSPSPRHRESMPSSAAVVTWP